MSGALIALVLGEWIACAAVGYLLGNFQTAVLVSKRYYHDDVRDHGSGNAGSTNMVRVFGYKPGLVTFAGDFLKAVAGVLLGRLICGTSGGYIGGFFVVIGHCWPAFAKFRGGKGVASSCGVAFMTFPLGALVALSIGGLIAVLTKRVSLMSLIGILLFFVSVLLFRRTDLPLVILAALLFCVVYLRHIDNIKRLFKGEEKPLRKEE